MKPLQECQLYTFIDTAYLGGRAPDEIARRLCDGGSDLIQVRAKGVSSEEVWRLAEKVLPVTEAAGVGLVINDYPEVAAGVGAAMVHLGQEDFAAGGFDDIDGLCRHWAGKGPRRERLRVGLSTHGPAEAEAAIVSGADYIGVGPVFATGTKPEARPVSLEYVRWAAAHVSRPWFAIGGINLANLESVLDAGARRICVVSAILSALDVGKACQQFKVRLLSAGQDQKR